MAETHIAVLTNVCNYCSELCQLRQTSTLDPSTLYPTPRGISNIFKAPKKCQPHHTKLTGIQGNRQTDRVTDYFMLKICLEVGGIWEPIKLVSTIFLKYWNNIHIF